MFFSMCAMLPRAAGALKKMASEKIKLSANIAARVDLIGGREQAHRGGHTAAVSKERECRDQVHHGSNFMKFCVLFFGHSGAGCGSL